MLFLCLSQIPDEPITTNPPEPVPSTTETAPLAPPVNPTAEVDYLPADTTMSAPDPDPGLHVEAKEEVEARKEPEKEVLPPGAKHFTLFADFYSPISMGVHWSNGNILPCSQKVPGSNYCKSQLDLPWEYFIAFLYAIIFCSLPISTTV